MKGKRGKRGPTFHLVLESEGDQETAKKQKEK